MKLLIKRITNNVGYIIVAFATALLSPLVIMAFFMRPIADDYAYFSDPNIGNPFRFALSSYFEQTGRALQAFWTSILYGLFNDKAVIFGAIIQLILLVIVCIACCLALFYRKKEKSNVKLIALGLLVAVVSVLASPSLFDTYLWLTSSTVYLASLIALFSSLTVAALIFRNRKLQNFKYYILLFIVVFASQFFSEPTSMIMIYLSALVLFISIFIFKNKKLSITSLVCLSGSFLGLLAVYFSPGSRGRQVVSGSHFNLYDMFISSLKDVSKMSYLFTTYRVLIIIILALFISLLITHKLSKKTTLYIITASSISALLLSYFLFITARYSMGSYMPHRAFSATSVVVSLFIAIAIGVAISYLTNNINIAIKQRLLVFAIIPLVLISTIFAYKNYLPIVRAVAIRSTMYDNRDDSIKKQLESKSEVISIIPVPILIKDSNAIDFQYAEKQIDWFEYSFKRYYLIPDEVDIEYDVQPDLYCVYSNNPDWSGSKTCPSFN